MAPRKTRATTAAKRLAASRSVAPTRGLRRHESTEREELKTEDPDSDHMLEQGTQTKTPPSSRLKRASSSEDVFSRTFLSQAGRNSSTLSKKLKQMWQTLQHTASTVHQQEDGVLDVHATQKVQLVATELVQTKLLQHSDQHVRSLVACCLVELLRVSAPDSPFGSPKELYRVFQLFIEQFQALGQETTTKTTELHQIYVLESLTIAKTCLLVVDLDYTENDDPRVMVQLFATLLATIDNKHSVKLETLILSLMVTCIEESGEVSAPLLDVILQPLVQTVPISEHHDNTKHSLQLVRALIQRTSDVLQSPLSHYLTNLLVDATSLAKLNSPVYTLIEAVHAVTPSLLRSVLPTVCLQLQAEDVATRATTITLMGNLFASAHVDFGHEILKHLRDFLSRLCDANVSIRLQMIRASVAIWESHNHLTDVVEKELKLRLQDPEWQVRQLVVRELCDLAANNLELLSEATLRAIGERMKDKKVALRKETMTGLTQVFRTHISSSWKKLENATGVAKWEDTIVARNKWAKLAWIPDYVLKCFAYPQEELKLRLLQLLDDLILPKVLTDRTRAQGLAYLFHSFDTTSKEALRRLLRERAKCQAVCAKFVAFKTHQRRQNRHDDRAVQTATKKLYDGLLPLFPEVQMLQTFVAKLATWKDHKVFTHLQRLCDWTTSQRASRQARDDLVRSVGARTTFGAFVKTLCRKLALLTVNQASIDWFLDAVEQRGRSTRRTRSLMDLIVMVSQELPRLFDPFIRTKVAALVLGHKREVKDEVDPNVMLGLLHVLANYAQHWTHWKGEGDGIKDDDIQTMSKDVAKRLERFCLGEYKEEANLWTARKTIKAAKVAAVAMAGFYGKTTWMTQVMTKLSSSKRLVGSEAGAALQSLAVFAKRCSNQFSASLFHRIWTLLFDEWLSHEEDLGSNLGIEQTVKSNRGTAAKITDTRCAAIKVLVNLLVYSTEEAVDEASKLIKLLIEILRTHGKTFASTNATAATCRATASCGLMKMMRRPYVEALLSVSEWHSLGFSIQDSSEEVRRRFLTKLTSHLVKQPLQNPHRYLSYLALAATETNASLKKEARKTLTIAVERMRRMFDAVSASSSPAQDASLSAVRVPEYALPYVLHLLAHCPTFPTHLIEKSPMASVLQSAEWTDQLAYLDFFLDGLVSAKLAADNIAFLLQILTKLAHYHDVLAPTQMAMYPLIDSTAVLLKKKIKKQSDLKPFPGNIYLPKHLFSLGRPNSLATSERRKELDSLPLRGSRLGASLSPIKPMDFAAHFLKLQSPPGSSLKSSRKKRKRSFNPMDDGDARDLEDKGLHEAEGEAVGTTLARRASVLGQRRPVKRTFADDSSESGAESDTLKRRSLSIASVASSLDSVAFRHAIAETIEEEEESEISEKRGVSKGVTADALLPDEKGRA